jgi:hypothetical protein
MGCGTGGRGRIDAVNGFRAPWPTAVLAGGRGLRPCLRPVLSPWVRRGRLMSGAVGTEPGMMRPSGGGAACGPIAGIVSADPSRD